MASRRFIAGMGGFTLLEIMVALAIFATLAAAVLSASQYVVKQTGAVEERLFAAWLADNRLNELRLQPGAAAATSNRSCTWIVATGCCVSHQCRERSAPAPGRDRRQPCRSRADLAPRQRLDTRSS